MIEKYCRICGYEIPHDGMTMYLEKKICKCKKEVSK